MSKVIIKVNQPALSEAIYGKWSARMVELKKAVRLKTIAEEIGIHETTLRRVLEDENFPISPSTVKKIAVWLRVAPSKFLL